jgi:hypothetical protein
MRSTSTYWLQKKNSELTLFFEASLPAASHPLGMGAFNGVLHVVHTLPGDCYLTSINLKPDLFLKWKGDHAKHSL